MAEIKPKHSPIGASSMHRWSKCPGSNRKCEGLENKSSIAALEGTAAHELIGLALERAISSNTPTRDILENTFKAVSLYSDYIESLKEKIQNAVVHIEHSFDMSNIYPMLYGTADAVVYDPLNKILHVIDYKHGEGIPVEVYENKQLSYYALGALTTLMYPAKEIVLTIVQPRRYHPDGPIRTWRVPVTYLIDFRQDLIDAAKETENPNAKLVAGSHCLFCLAKKDCDEFKNLKTNEAKKEFTFYQDPKKDFDPI